MIFNAQYAEFQRLLLKYSEAATLEAQRRDNVQRFIAYNNRRIRAGLRPLDIPQTLAYPTGWNKPINRDNLALLQR